MIAKGFAPIVFINELWTVHYIRRSNKLNMDCT